MVVTISSFLLRIFCSSQFFFLIPEKAQRENELISLLSDEEVRRIKVFIEDTPDRDKKGSSLCYSL